MTSSKRINPLYLQLAVLSCYAIVARELFHFERGHAMTLALCLWACLLDLALGYWYFKAPKKPLSALIIALACSLLLDSGTPAIYFAALTLGILSKAFLTWQGRHYFNPSNFGVVACLLLFPALTTGMPALFGGNLWTSAVFFAMGLGVAVYAGRGILALAWLLGFAAFAVLRSRLTLVPLQYVIAVMLSPGFILFSFHMITDPATSPRGAWGSVAFGVAIAGLDALFRFYQIPYGNFYSLFLVTAIMPLLSRPASSPQLEAYPQVSR